MPELDKELSGRELDAAIHRDVMQIVWNEKLCRACGLRLDSSRNFCTPESCSLRPYPKERADEPPNYSQSMEAAMQVVAKLEKDNMISLTHFANLPSESKWIVSLSSCAPGYIDVRGEAETLPEAICRAALVTIGSKVDQGRSGHGD